jgi:hypothetical protein
MHVWNSLTWMPWANCLWVSITAETSIRNNKCDKNQSKSKKNTHFLRRLSLSHTVRCFQLERRPSTNVLHNDVFDGFEVNPANSSILVWSMTTNRNGSSSGRWNSCCCLLTAAAAAKQAGGRAAGSLRGAAVACWVWGQLGSTTGTCSTSWY